MKIKITLALLVLLNFAAFGVKAEPWRVKYSADPATHQLNDLSVPSRDVIYVVGGGAITGGPGVILKSEDGGETWVEKYRNEAHAIYAIDCQSSLVCYAAGEGGRIYKTINGGMEPGDWVVTVLRDTRAFIAGPDPEPTFYDIKVVNASTVVVVGTGGAIFRTTSSGAVWGVLDAPAIPVNFETQLESVHFSGSTGYIGGAARTILKSIDNGSSWALLSIPAELLGSCADVFTLDGEKLWTAAFNIGKSENGGDSFGVSFIPPGNNSSIAFIDASNGWATNSLFGGFIRKTSDGGLTWPETPSEDISILNADGSSFSVGTQFREIEFRNANLGFVVGDGVIARRYIPYATVRGGDTTLTLYPNLVPDSGWSHACSNSSESIYHIIAGVRNNGQAGIAASQFPFSVRLETLGEDGNPIPGASGTYPINAFPPEWAIVMIDVTEGGTISSDQLYQRFNPRGVSNPRIRMTVDVDNVVREAENPSGAWENDNVMEREIACGPVVTRREGIPQPSPPPRPSGEKEKKKKIEQKKKVEEKKKKSKWGK